MLQCVLLPRGAPDPGAPPCIRQRLFPLTAGDIHGLPERVLAPQRGLESIGPVLRGWLVVILFYLRVRGSGTGSGSLMTLLGACGAQYGHYPHTLLRRRFLRRRIIVPGNRLAAIVDRHILRCGLLLVASPVALKRFY
jgi:hypothetical protein